MKLHALSAALLATLLGSCGNDELPKYQLLDRLRVLALKADLPEVAPGASVTLTPLVSDPLGGSRTLTYNVETCLDPGVGIGADVSCAHDPTKTTQSGSISFADARRTAVAPTFTITVPATVFSGRSALDQFNGVAYLVLYRVSAAGGEATSSFRRIVATTRAMKNANPLLGQITVDGSAISSLPATEKALKATISAGAETFDVKGQDGSLRSRAETLTLTWFINEGELKYARTQADSTNLYTPPASPSALGPFLVVVLRDDRGGVDFAGVPGL